MADAIDPIDEHYKKCQQGDPAAFHKLEKLVQVPKATSQTMLYVANCYHEGWGTVKDLQQAFFWFQKAAGLGNSAAMFNLAICYEKGEGCEKDLTQAVAWYKKAAELGNSDAMFNLAICYKKGEGIKKDLTQAVAWYKKAAELGNNAAMNNLAICYEKGEGCEKDLTQAVAWYKKAAELGNSDAMFNLAICYKKGEGIKKDLTQAVAWYKKAAELGDRDAMNNLASCYRTGEGIEKDLTQAVTWYKKAAGLGNSAAMNNLAICYEKGEGCEKDLTQAFFWIQQAAELGNSDAMFNLAICYKKGEGIKKDLTQAVTWYQQAAELGDRDAMNNLAICYEKGEGIKKDLTQAVAWYKKAAGLGNSAAMNNLAICYEKGEGIKKDLTQAVAWYKKAAELGSSRAIYNLARLYREQRGQKSRKIVQMICDAVHAGLPGSIQWFEQELKRNKLATLRAEVYDVYFALISDENQSSELPKELCHFTNLDAVESMLGYGKASSSACKTCLYKNYQNKDETQTAPEKLKNCIRLYNVNYMNDPSEGRAVFVSKELSEEDRTLIQFFFPTDAKTKEIDISSKDFGIYSCSFTSEQDQLNLWRAYGTDGTGLCLVIPANCFDRDSASLAFSQYSARGPKFTESVSTESEEPEAQKSTTSDGDCLTEIKPLKVNYRVEKKTKEELLAMLKKLQGKIRRLSDQQTQAKAKEIVSWLLYEVLYRFKNPQYAAEHEYRLLSAHHITDPKIKLDDRTPPHLYVETKNFLFECPGTKIIIGPRTSKAHEVKLYLEYLLAQREFDKNVTVSLSTVPYR